jgi:hypothetical protein
MIFQGNMKKITHENNSSRFHTPGIRPEKPGRNNTFLLQGTRHYYVNFRKSWYVIPMFLLAVAIVSTAGCTGTAPPAIINSATSDIPQVTPNDPVPDITGVWTGTTIGHTRADGFREHSTVKFNITEQKGQVFTGMKEYQRADGIMYYENLSGVITHNGKISMADHEDGTITGEFTGQNEIELVSLQPGDDAKAYLIHLTRQTS